MIRVVAFDWGNTVMYDLDQFQHLGPMVNWPYVEVVPGIEDALRALQPDYTLVIATNAILSMPDRVRAALARANLDHYFTRVWTALELGVAKPEPAYYTVLEQSIGCAPEEFVMVGDSFGTDVLGAKQAGWRAIWYNAAGNAPPPDSALLPDITIRDLAELADAVRALG